MPTSSLCCPACWSPHMRRTPCSSIPWRDMSAPPGSSWDVYPLATPAFWAEPYYHYYSRTVIGGALLGLCIAAVIFRFTRLYRLAAKDDRLLIARTLIALVASVIPDVHYTMKWRRFLGGFEAVVNSRTGLAPFEEARIPLATTFGLSWGYPTLSVLLRNAPSHAVVLNSRPRRCLAAVRPHIWCPKPGFILLPMIDRAAHKKLGIAKAPGAARGATRRSHSGLRAAAVRRLSSFSRAGRDRP